MPKPKGQTHRKNHEVGYGRPPKEHQFKKGQSGNPRGRPKGSKSFKTIVPRVMNEKLRVREADSIRTMSKREAVVRTLVAAGLKGDLRAIDKLREYDPADDATDRDQAISVSDEEILQRFLANRSPGSDDGSAS